MKNGKEKYQEKTSQKKRLLEVLKEGKKVCQIDLGYYLALRENTLYRLLYKTTVVDAIADLGIANLPARIFGLKKDGYKIITETVKVKGRFCNTHYSVYSLDKTANQA